MKLEKMMHVLSFSGDAVQLRLFTCVQRDGARSCIHQNRRAVDEFLQNFYIPV